MQDSGAPNPKDEDDVTEKIRLRASQPFGLRHRIPVYTGYQWINHKSQHKRRCPLSIVVFMHYTNKECTSIVIRGKL
jgi:hypothetical protein